MLSVYWVTWKIVFSFDIGLDKSYDLVVFLFIIFYYLYLVEMKRRWGSIGNLVTFTKLADIFGNRPSALSMIARTSFIVLGMSRNLADYIWVCNDPNRQMLRDKLSGTFVLKKGRKSIGQGRVSNRLLFFFGLAIFVDEPSNKTEYLSNARSVMD